MEGKKAKKKLNAKDDALVVIAPSTNPFQKKIVTLRWHRESRYGTASSDFNSNCNSFSGKSDCEHFFYTKSDLICIILGKFI